LKGSPSPIKEVIDLSVPVKSLDTPAFPGHPQPLRTQYKTVREDGYLNHVWTLAEHTGTHVDAPVHFMEGKTPVDEVPLERFVCEGLVLDFSRKPEMYSITTEDLKAELKKSGREVGPGWILLFYTGYTSKSRTAKWMKHPELSGEASKFIAKLDVSAIGFDAPSPDHDPFPAHKILLPKMICIYENLSNLEKVLKKSFIFVGAPLLLSGGSASPVRAIALVR
jgi:arylformamidase